MTSFLTQREIRIFDYPRFAEPLREAIRANAEGLAKAHGVAIEFVRQSKLQRKEKRIAAVLSQRGPQPGLVHILSAMERCPSYKPWPDKQTHKSFLKPDDGKCLHYYFYFIDEQLGLIYVRVPTWCPFRLQVYFNGHHLLASKLKEHGIEHRLLDNAFVEVSDWEKAQQLSDDLDIARLHQKLDDYAQLCCPIIEKLSVKYHWSLMQVEYATDIVFKRQQDLALLYDPLARTAIHTVKPEHIATFLGRKLDDRYRDEVGNRFDTRIEGTCIRHRMGSVSLRLYDKFGLVLRIETTVNDPSFFKHHRWVEQKNGQREFKLAPLKKSIYSLFGLADLLRAANRRYLEFISELDDPSAGRKLLNQVCQPKQQQGRSYFVIGCEQEADARTIMAVLPKRFARYRLTIHPEKTKLVQFGKPSREAAGSGNGTFDFLGFTHYWARTRRGAWDIKRATARKRLRRAIKRVWQWCRAHRHDPVLEQYRTLSAKLRGHYQYYGVPCNSRRMGEYLAQLQRAWRYWLSRRGQKHALSWKEFHNFLAALPLPKPKIVHGT